MKIGIIGTNFISDNMVEASKTSGLYDLEIVCSRNIDNAKDFANKHGIDNFTDKYEDFLVYDLDAVYIAVPNALHFDIAKFFLNEKIAVFCEKPMASNYKEVKELIDLSKEKNTLLMEGIVPIYTEGFKAIKDNLVHIGEVRSAIFSMNQYSSRYDAYRDGVVLNAFKNSLSNGSTMDIAIYPLSVAIALFGKPNDISASAFILDSKVDGKGTILLHYDTKDVIITHSKINNQILKPEIQGEDGVIQINHISLVDQVSLQLNKEELKVVYEDFEVQSMLFEFIDFANAYKNNQIEVFEGAHQLSLDIHEILTKARNICGIVFPADNK